MRSLAKRFSLFLATCIVFSGGAFAQKSVYRFSPVNQWDITKTASYWNPIIKYVSQKSGVTLELKIGRTSADTTAYVLAEEVEFIFSNHLFNPERMRLGWKVFGRRNTPLIYAQIAVASDSKIVKIGELQDLEVAFAGNEAFIGYKVPMAHLLANSVRVKPVFSGNQNAAFAQLFSGRAKAVGSNSMLVEGYAKRESKQFRVLWTSGGFHDLALMASSKVPQADLQAVSAAFLAMHTEPNGRSVLESASAEVSLTAQDYFIAASIKDYQNYVKFFESAPAHLQ